jgi:hypothetical protein
MKRISSLLITVFALSVQAAGIPSVQVQCQLAEARYRFGKPAADIETAESECSALLADLLSDRIEFVHFQAGVAGDKTLIVRIGKSEDEADPGDIRPVLMEIRLSGAGLPEQPAPINFSFRKVEEWFSAPTMENFPIDVAARFADELATREGELVESQLSRLVIADDAFVLPEDKSWLLPFTREELRLGDNSVLNIKAVLKRPDSEERFLYTVTLFGDFFSSEEVPVQYHNKVKALHMGDDKFQQAESIEWLKSADNVDVLYVVVSRYVPVVETSSTSPSELVQDPGGQP